MLKRLLFSTLLACWVFPAMASHLMGGEITWKCLPTGQFQFYMKLYRDCNGVTALTTATINVYNHPTLTSITMNLLTQTDISPVCNGAGPTITCAGGGQGATEEYVYQSAPLTISGVPPAQGWAFVYNDCCRNMAITNLNLPAAQSGFALRAFMYAYNGQNTNPCFDNSPEFLESPKTIICTGYPFTYNHNAVDAELDSLAYDWGQPLDWMPAGGAFNPGVNPVFYPFNAGYSFNSPLPGTSQNANNVPATIDPNTGEISYTSFTSGNFVTCIKVEAWKCGTKVAEIYREIQVVLLSCGSNVAPSVMPPFQNPSTLLYTEFKDTVYAGQSVAFQLTATDFGFLPNGNPQTLTINATGNEFGAGFTSTTTGCLNPPCATLTPPPPVSAPFGASTNFFWQTDCNHVSYTNQCFVQSNTYNFIIRTADDYCPAPALNIATISITVLALPVVESPNLHCVAVQPNGDVTLTWDLQPDTANTFNSYHIFASNSLNGPYTDIDSIFNINQLTYTHVGANANNGPVYYYVQTRSGCAGMVYTTPQDTLESMYLTVTNPGNGTAGLGWNALSTPNPGSSSAWYHIWREYPTGNWVMIDSTQSLSYVDTITVCNAWVNYRIELGDTLGCTSVSNIDGDQFQDITVPNGVVIDTVTVTNNQALLGWEQSTSTDVEGYIIYQFINGIWTAIDTVTGINVTNYLNTLSNAGAQVESYAVSPYDSCGNVSPFSPVHQTIHLTDYLDVCNASTILTWNSYINMASLLGGYNIYTSVDGGPYTLIGSTAPGDTTFTHTGLVQFSNYCYYIQAYNAPNDMTASSQIVCVFANVPQQPVFEYLKVATVAASNQVKLQAYIDVAADIIRYDVYRADNLTGPYTLIGSVPAVAAQPIVTYYDNTAHTNEQSYYYKMQAIDSCSNPSLSTNISRTIFLSAQALSDVTNRLSWNDYETWLGTVNHYRIYRAIDGVFAPQPIANIPYTAAGTNNFTDDVGTYLNSNLGQFSYYVEAYEGSGNPYAFTDTSMSNVADVQQDPHVYVPNAFTPNGLNPIFLPATGFVDLNQYNFAIFDRWGEKLFETSDRQQGWDGRYHGKFCEQAVYVWTLTFKTAQGEYIDRKGTVTLLR